MKLSLTKSEFSGFVTCLEQVTNIKVRYIDNNLGYVALSRDEFIAALAGKDAKLAELTGTWWDAAVAVRTHIQTRTTDTVRPSSEPFELGVGGFVG